MTNKPVYLLIILITFNYSQSSDDNSVDSVRSIDLCPNDVHKTSKLLAKKILLIDKFRIYLTIVNIA